MQQSFIQTYGYIKLKITDSSKTMSSIRLPMQQYFLFASLGELRQKKVYKKEDHKLEKRRWCCDSQWQLVYLSSLESLMVPAILKFYHSSAVNKHLCNEGWFKQKITPAVDVSLSIIFSDKQVCKRSTYELHPLCDGIHALLKEKKGIQMSCKGNIRSRLKHKRFRSMNINIYCKNPLFFSLKYLIQHTRCMCLVDETGQYNNRGSRTARVWRYDVIKAGGHVGPRWSPDQGIKCWLVDLVCSFASSVFL